jgi:two-component system chemotaxis sensor kinase CheA
MSPKSATAPRSQTAGSRPASKSFVRTSDAHARGPATSSPKARTIMVVEDSMDTREFFALALEDAGYRVLTAESYDEALRMLRVGNCIDAILVDYNLGDGNGAALIHQARNEGFLERETPALICTAYRYVEMPPNVAIIHKPLEEAELLREIARALDGAVA